MNVIKPTYEILTKFSDGGIEELKFIEKIARVCYKSENYVSEDGGSAKGIIKNLIKNGHTAMLEHLDFAVKFTVDRGVSHEIVRHRIASFAQESTRYCNYTSDKFDNQIMVIDISTGFNYDLSNPNDLKKYETWIEAMANAEKSYFEMIDLGARPEEARSVLPTSLKTEIVVTMNLREWRHFFNLRAVGTTGKPHPQIKEVSEKLLAEIKTKLPVFFDDIEVK